MIDRVRNRPWSLLALSIGHWGAAETWEFVNQPRQRPDLLEPG
jgi:hypothetical protein